MFRFHSRGVILPLLAMLIFALLMFAAIAVDTFRITTSQSQQHHTAEYIALAALESFVATEPASGTEAEKLEEKLRAAVKRAETTAGLNFLLGEPGKKQLDRGELGYEEGHLSGDDHRNIGGVIRPGRWWFVPPASCSGAPSPCPCKAGASGGAFWDGPCFQPTPPGDPVINAFQVELRTKEDSPIRTLFARVGGQESVSLHSRATASLAPRHLLFLVDLSNSTEHETHLTPPVTRDPTQYSAYAFPLKYARYHDDPSDATLWRCNRDGERDRCPNSSACRFMQRRYHNNYPGGHWDSPRPTNLVFNGGAEPEWQLGGLENRRPAGTVGPRTKHYKSDYVCYILRNGNEDEHWLIGTGFSNPSYSDPNYYVGPEPLMSILGSVHTALEAFEARAVAGDLAGMIGYDDYRRSYTEERTFELSPPGSETFNTLKRVTDVSSTDPAIVRERLAHFLFPEMGSYTYTQKALDEAIQRLKSQPLHGIAESSIVLFTDGLTNCRKTPPSYGRPHECGNEFANHGLAMNELGEYSVALNEAKIKLHVLLIGDVVAPHTLLAKSQRDPNSCMDADEAAALGVLFTNPFIGNRSPTVDWNPYGYSFNNMSPLTPFHYPNLIYTMVRNSSGSWLPLRPCCRDASGRCADVTARLNEACANASLGRSTTVEGADLVVPPTVVVSPYTDRSGRLICDPKGRSKAEQARDAMLEIMHQNPFLLVE